MDEARTGEISSVLSYYYSEFTTYLATTISFTETLPEEINNQIRDAFTHLSRANASGEIDEIKQECRLAKRHVDRANRDCLKVSIIKARLELDQLIEDAVFYHGFLTPSIKASYKDVKAQRKKAYLAETRNESGIVENLEEVLRLTMFTADEVKAQYSVAGKTKTRIFRTFKRWFRPIAIVATLLIGTIIGVVLRPQIDQIFSFIIS